jgi:hypothetical protein
MPPGKFTFDSKYLSAGLAGVGVLALAAAGFVTITTPAEQECRDELTEVRVELADKSARLELLEEAKEACKDALKVLTRSGDSS